MSIRARVSFSSMIPLLLCYEANGLITIRRLKKMIINCMVNKKVCMLKQSGSMRNKKLSRIPILKYLTGVSTGACNGNLQGLKRAN